jgi:hypothetical protein
MPPFGPIKRADLIRQLRRNFGFTGPYAGGQHNYMIRGDVRLTIPNPHRGDIGPGLLATILPEASISREEWESAS